MAAASCSRYVSSETNYNTSSNSSSEYTHCAWTKSELFRLQSELKTAWKIIQILQDDRKVCDDAAVNLRPNFNYHGNGTWTEVVRNGRHVTRENSINFHPTHEALPTQNKIKNGYVSFSLSLYVYIAF